MRRFLIAAVVAGCLPASSACAARIFGDIRLDGKPVPEGLLIMVTRVVAPPAGDAKNKLEATPGPTDSTVTDKVGSYKVTVKDEGKCKLTLVYEKKPVSLEVFSYAEATRYDLILEKKADKLTLRRK